MVTHPVTIWDTGALYTEAEILLHVSLGPATAHGGMIEFRVSRLNAALGNFRAGAQDREPVHSWTKDGSPLPRIFLQE